MLTLSNGDKWIISEDEYEEAGISYEDACKCLIPQTTHRQFIEQAATGDWCDARKWTDFEGGYWDANFDFREVFADAAERVIEAPWCQVYVMPWGTVYVTYFIPDSGGYDATLEIETYENFNKYKEVAGL